MKNFPLMLKPLALSIALIAIFTAGQKVAKADSVNFVGSANGCFNCGPSGPFSNSASLPPGLTYRGSLFNITTNSQGNASIGNNVATPNFNNLGSFSLTGDPARYNGSTFTLRVTFTAPPGAQSPTFTANVTGTIEAPSQGNLRINFDNSFQTFSFANGGSFQFRVNDVSITPGGTIALSGDIRNATAAVPEPATMILLGTGLAGVAASIRKRRKGAQN